MTEAPFPTVTVDDVEGLIADGWSVLDVRTDEEWAEGHLDGAQHIPLQQLPERLGEVDDKIICQCAVGGRSAQATEYLLGQGREAVNLDGGIQAWLTAGRPVVG